MLKYRRYNMKKNKKNKNNIEKNIDIRPSKEYSTKELLELGKQRNILKLAPLISDDKDNQK